MKVELLCCNTDNYAYLLRDPHTQDAILIDPGEPAAILHELHRRPEIHLRAICCTHHHADHIGGLQALLRQYGEIPVYAHRSDVPRIPAVTFEVEDSRRVQAGSIEMQFLHTPGHTLGGCCILADGNLFSGDTLFVGGCGRLFEGTAAQMHQSLQRLAALPPETCLYAGHEYTLANLAFAEHIEPRNAQVQRLRERLQAAEPPLCSMPGSIGMEREINPFLRTMVPAVHEAVERLAQRECRNSVQVFAALRQLKDHF